MKALISCGCGSTPAPQTGSDAKQLEKDVAEWLRKLRMARMDFSRHPPTLVCPICKAPVSVLVLADERP